MRRTVRRIAGVATRLVCARFRVCRCWRRRPVLWPMPAALRLMAPRCVARNRFLAPLCRLFEESQHARTSRVYKGAREASSARQGSMMIARAAWMQVTCRCRREGPARGAAAAVCSKDNACGGRPSRTFRRRTDENRSKCPRSLNSRTNALAQSSRLRAWQPARIARPGLRRLKDDR